MSWLIYAALSAFFAGITALLAKIGVENVSSNVATLVRTFVILLFIIGIVVATNEIGSLKGMSAKTWTFLVLSGLATGLSWLCYFAALKAGPVSHVAPIDKLSFVIAILLAAVFLHERISMLTGIGIVLIVSGVMLTLPTVQAALSR